MCNWEKKYLTAYFYASRREKGTWQIICLGGYCCHKAAKNGLMVAYHSLAWSCSSDSCVHQWPTHRIYANVCMLYILALTHFVIWTSNKFPCSQHVRSLEICKGEPIKNYTRVVHFNIKNLLRHYSSPVYTKSLRILCKAFFKENLSIQ